MRISRPCYDKMHRCPGWAGGGMLYAKVDRCKDGKIAVPYGRPFWKWRACRCDRCDVLVLPYHVRWLDWRWTGMMPERWWRELKWKIEYRRHRLTLLRELRRVLTEPSRQVNPRVFAIVAAMLVVMVFGLVVSVALERWWAAAIYLVVGAVYTVLVYRHWPWRKG